MGISFHTFETILGRFSCKIVWVVNTMWVWVNINKPVVFFKTTVIICLIDRICSRARYMGSVRGGIVKGNFIFPADSKIITPLVFSLG